MKTAIARLLAGYRALVKTPYDVPADHAYSRQSMDTQRAVQDAAAYLADRTGERVAVIDTQAGKRSA